MLPESRRSCGRRIFFAGLTCALGLALAPTPARAEVRARGEALLLHHGSGAELEVQLHARLGAAPAAAATAGAAESPAARPVARPTSDIPAAVPAIKFYPFTNWRTEGGEQVSEVAAPTGLRLAVHVREEADGHFSIRMEASAAAAAWVGLLSLEAEVQATDVQVAGRDLRPHALGRVAALSGLDPKWVILRSGLAPAAPGATDGAGLPGLDDAWTVVVDDQADGLKVLHERPRLRLQADLLSTEARPFSHFINCTDNWRSPNHRVELPARQLQEGEALAVTMSLYAGGAVPLFKARYPEGRSAALVITDHADQTAAPTLRALAGGTSDATAPGWGKGGLLGSGLLITKALWLSSGEPAPAPLVASSAPAPVFTAAAALRGPLKLGRLRRPSRTLQSFRQRYERPQVDPTGGGRPQLDDPEVAELAERLAKAGWELAPHSATPLRDERERTEEALQFFERWQSRTWIDHQPYTNCEALINRGYQTGEFGIVDLLSQHSYGYAWSGLDVAANSTLNLLAPRHLEHYVPVLWPSGRLWPGTPTGLWLFSSMTTYMDSAKFFALYKKKALDQLERERGLHIAHTYLESFHPPGSMFAKRNLMVPGHHPGEIVPHPKLAELFQQLAARVRRGTLWVPTLQQLGDHMRGMAEVTVRLGSDGSATVRAERAVAAATFVIPAPNLRVLIDGQPVKGLGSTKTETTFWVDLPAGKPVRVELLDKSGKALSILRPPVKKSLLAGLPPPGHSLPARAATAAQ